MNVFNLFAKLKLDKKDYDKGIDEAKKKGSEFAEHTEKKVSPKAIAGWAAIVAAIMKAVQAITKLWTSTIQYADTVTDLAAQYGVATDSISEMQYVASQSSTTVEQLTSSMTMLLNRAKTNGEVFQKMGISVKDANGQYKAMDELFYETIGALNDIDNEGEKSALMLNLFGRSAMSVGEVVRKSSDEIVRMRQEAHDLGIVMSKETVQYASDFNDELAGLKLQGKSAIASIIAGAPDAEERFEKFMDNLLEKLDKYLPAFVKFAVKVLHEIGTQLLHLVPRLVSEIITSIIDAINETNWIEVGWEVGKNLVLGIFNAFKKFFTSSGVWGAIFGMPLKGTIEGFSGEDELPESAFGQEYEMTENLREDINIKIEASGQSTINKETAEATAEALAPYIDKILGGK